MMHPPVVMAADRIVAMNGFMRHHLLMVLGFALPGLLMRCFFVLTPGERDAGAVP
ncbi:MAG TPA: hypothetical protein VM711_05600 [Sphingomicrobium sp.]|nr:hypothetical protein [Sphingomicrobium sp.]